MSESSATRVAMNEIHRERQRQDKKWGQQDHPDGKWLAILGDEVGEVATATLMGTEGVSSIFGRS